MIKTMPVRWTGAGWREVDEAGMTTDQEPAELGPQASAHRDAEQAAEAEEQPARKSTARKSTKASE